MLLLLQDPGAAQPAEWREIRQVDRGEGQRGPRGGLLLRVGEGQCRPRVGLLLQEGEGQPVVIFCSGEVSSLSEIKTSRNFFFYYYL